MYEAKIKTTEALIRQVFPKKVRGREAVREKNITGFVYVFNKYADFFGVDTPLEVCHFIAQVGHECDSFNAFREYASGSAYEGRKDLGNTVKGDGVRFAGRGAIQTTGRTNYIATGRKMLQLPFLHDYEKKYFENDAIVKKPELLEDPVWGTLAAFIYWTDKDLNSLCRKDTEKVTIKRFNGKVWYNYTCSPIEAITRKVNGGLNGFKDRIKHYEDLKKHIKC